ncbi:hypothetical protein FHT21_000437 [Pedobacter sp. SG908]|nr:hypothetical protein [Pedobacter sp. SG908]NMN35397.1 hypothetical protein [Pedobacter sp. SG918]
MDISTKSKPVRSRIGKHGIQKEVFWTLTHFITHFDVSICVFVAFVDSANSDS